MSKRNIVTAMVAVTAVMLVIVVLLKTNVLGGGDATSTATTVPETVIETSVVYMSELNEDGDIEYYTMLTSYVRPKVSSIFVYPSTVPRSTKRGETTRPFVEYSYTRYALDEFGNNVLDANGNPVIEVIIETKYVTEPPKTTAYVQKTNVVKMTDASGVPLTNPDGTPVTSVVVINPTTTKVPSTPEVTTSEKRTLIPEITFPSTRDGSTEDNIISSINEARTAAGLGSLKVSTGLKATAYVNSMQKAYPDFEGAGGTSGDVYSLLNVDGTNVATAVMGGNIGKTVAMNADYTKIGVAVVKTNGKLYTTIIFQ